MVWRVDDAGRVPTPGVQALDCPRPATLPAGRRRRESLPNKKCVSRCTRTARNSFQKKKRTARNQSPSETVSCGTGSVWIIMPIENIRTLLLLYQITFTRLKSPFSYPKFSPKFVCLIFRHIHGALNIVKK